MTVNHNRRPYLWGMLAILGAFLILPLLPYALADKDSFTLVPNPGADLWRDARRSLPGTTQVKGVVETGVLIQDTGERWRIYRIRQLVPYGAYILGGVLGLSVLYFLVRGRVRIAGGRSGRTIQRNTRLEQGVHWFTAILFIILGLSGLTLLYGKWVLIPLLGPEGFAATAQICKQLHSYSGPLFVIALVPLFGVFLRDSLFNPKVDLDWLMTAGGYLGGRHPSSEKFDAGQKLWYWVAVLAGVVLSISGLLLDFPNLGQGRELLQLSYLFHTIAGVIILAFFIVHVSAAIGIEGALEAMVEGKVDANWAKQHHDLWYKKLDTAGSDEEVSSDKGNSAATDKQVRDC